MSGLEISRRSLIAGAGALMLPAVSAHGPSHGQTPQPWPSQPIRIVCGYPAGGLVDLFARAYGDYLSQRLGQPVVVENKPGAGGTIAAVAVKASSDGHTLLFTAGGTLLTNPVLYRSLPYDPDRDFVPIASMSGGHLPFLASKATGATNVKEFIEYARTNPTSVGTWAPGSFAHIVVAELNGHFGLQMAAVHYRGEPPMWQDLAAGVLQAAMGSYLNAANILQSGAGRAIAVPQSTRMRKLPEVATFIEQGVTSPAFSLKGYICLVGTAGMPHEHVERLSDLMVQAGRTEAVQRLLDTFGIDEAAIGHAEFKTLYDAEKPIWRELIGSLGLARQ
jgi:tripartite-type tricarboxylate transporter receptor subunit TctC